MPFHRRLKSVLLSLAVISADHSPATAQELGGVLDLGQLGANIGVNNAIRAHVARSKNPHLASEPRRVAAERPNLNFAPSLERRRKNLAQFAARSRVRDPSNAAQMEKLFASQDVIGQMNGELARYGLQPHNVADAYTAWWVNAWLASRGRTDEPSPRQIMAIRAQAAQAMSTLPAMRNASEAVKQEMTEAYLIQTALIGTYMASGRSDPALRARIADVVRQGALASGLDLDSIELTDEGFVPS